MRFAIALLSALLLAGTAKASMPSSANYGAWFVTSITSLSGTSGDDASAILGQEYPVGRVALDWTQRGDVMISVRIESCHGEDGDLSHYYTMSPADMVDMPLPRLTAQLESDFSLWLAEARRICRHPERLRRFRLAQFADALADYVARLRYLGSIT